MTPEEEEQEAHRRAADRRSVWIFALMIVFTVAYIGSCQQAHRAQDVRDDWEKTSGCHWEGSDAFGWKQVC